MPDRRTLPARLPCLLVAIAMLAALSACRTPSATPSAARCEGADCTPSPVGTAPLAPARALAQRAARQTRDDRALRDWSQCAAKAFAVIADSNDGVAAEAAALATDCTDRFLQRALQRPARTWPAGPLRIGEAGLQVEHRGLSRNLGPALKLVRASDVSMAMYDGQRHATPGLGVPLATITPRCSDRPDCTLQPPEGVFRWATAWFEPGTAPGGNPRLVIADPLATGPVRLAGREVRLALDTSAHYAHGAGTSALPRLGILGLLGHDEVQRRSGVYVLGDYSATKRPLVMLHGLGSNPLIWAKLTNAVWADPALRERFQVWHVVYRTEAPLLITRLRVQAYLDDAWQKLDPEGDDPARQGMVLVGHSMGGVVSRLLCVDAGETLWDAAFTVPPDQLPASAADRAGIIATFRFTPYPGVTRAVFIAAPHRGSPSADRWFGRLTRALIGSRVPEAQALRRLALGHPDAVRPELRDVYRTARLNSIATLQEDQPVRRAGEQLMPAPGIPHHSIAGALRGRVPATDGAVPLASTVLPTAASSLVIEAGHDVYRHDDAVAEVLRILRLELEASR